MLTSKDELGIGEEEAPLGSRAEDGCGTLAGGPLSGTERTDERLRLVAVVVEVGTGR